MITQRKIIVQLCNAKLTRSRLPPLSPEALSKGAPFSNSELLNAFVPLEPGESGPDRMFNLDRCLVWQLRVESSLSETEYIEIRESVRRLITAILVERQRTLEWMEHQRRRDLNQNQHQVSDDWASDDETLVSLTPAQRRKKSIVDIWKPLSTRKVAERVSSDFQTAGERMTMRAMRLLSWLTEVPDGMPPGPRTMHRLSNELVTMAPAA